MKAVLKSATVSLISTNCYVLFDEESGDCAVVDPGEYTPELKEIIISFGVDKLKYILLTHGHFDHIGGVKELKKEYGGKIVISKTDEASFSDPDLCLGFKHNFFNRYPSKADLIVTDGDSLPFGDGEIKVISTPGHTAGSVCFILEDCLFSGDTLFSGSCGRTDFKTSDPSDMLASLKRLSSLEGNFKVFPGHGEFTELETERIINPFINCGR